MLKKIIIICFCLVILSALLVSCGEGSANDKDEGLSIVTTVFPQYDFLKNLTEGTSSKVSMLLPFGSEPHSYEPTPSDVITIAESDMFVWVGGESEAWADRLIAGAGSQKTKLIALMDIVPLLENENGHGGEQHSDHTHSEEEKHDHTHDEHVWTSPKNAVMIVERLAEELCALDEENSEIYRSNADSYIKRLVELDHALAALAGKAEKTLIFGDRFPFLYLTKEYGFKYTSPFSGCSSDTEASMAEIADVIAVAKREKAAVVFSVDFSNEKLAKNIAQEAGAKVLRLYSCHTLGGEDVKNGVGYIELMQKNLNSLEEAFKN